MKRQTSQQLAARRREVVSLTHKGWTQAAIASHLKIPQGTVSGDLAAMRGFWRDFHVYDFENMRFEQLQKIDLIEAEAWSAWQRSQQRRQSAAITRGKTGEQTRTSSQEQYGDPRYLREIGRCVAQRSQIIGVEPPTPPPESAKIEIPHCALTESFRYYLVLRGMLGDAPYKPRGALTAEHYAALVAEHERDPYLLKQWLQETERGNSTARDVAERPPAGHSQQPVSPGASPADDSCAERPL
jgi:hypothetical protein